MPKQEFQILAFLFFGGIDVQQLKERILKDGKCLSADILKVDSFLNHQIDVALLEEIGKEFAIFARASKAKLFTNFNSSNHWSCSEGSSASSWYVYFGDGRFGSGYLKNNSYVVRAVAAF